MYPLLFAKGGSGRTKRFSLRAGTRVRDFIRNYFSLSAK